MVNQNEEAITAFKTLLWSASVHADGPPTPLERDFFS
jgi:hypothetical protein